MRLVSIDGRNEYPAVLALRHQLASHLLGCAKPDARIYALAQSAFGVERPIAPNDIVFFDDLTENVAAARAAGWEAFHVDPLGDTVAQIRRDLRSVGIRAD